MAVDVSPVQDQFEFVHFVLMECLLGDNTSVPSANFRAYLDKLLVSTPIIWDTSL